MTTELSLIIKQNRPLSIFLWNHMEYVYFLDHIMTLNSVTALLSTSESYQRSIPTIASTIDYIIFSKYVSLLQGCFTSYIYKCNYIYFCFPTFFKLTGFNWRKICFDFMCTQLSRFSSYTYYLKKLTHYHKYLVRYSDLLCV